ncbi:MAG TPA: bifunctional DNA-formamidopyrimidine glycosylase/DNA-(apurinic or apyrimidinic site) lyase [Beijerinckiaceae bacterium]|nr:bifunctional DNA-formamidopyrimidine glycosylase/DNA-(apurinic or apyrimidinic site) lyase [Beijerinckiaceae bacterium]
MPELPEVETVRRGLAPVLEGQRLASVRINRPNLRFPFVPRFVERLTGQRVDRLNRRAKYLIADLGSGEHLILHLGMSGRFVVEQIDETRQPGAFHQAIPRLAAHDHVVFETAAGARIVYNDPRRFGFMVLVEAGALCDHPLLAGLGIEPLSNDFHAGAIDRLFAGKAAPLKAALLDQRLIAGLGNIYVCEALHRAGLSPARPAGTLSGARRRAACARERLAGAIRDVLTEAVAAGGSSISDHARTDGSLGYFQHAFRVYDREGAPCPTPGCHGHIQRQVQSGRSTFSCIRCQK